MLGPGKTMILEKKWIDEFIVRHNPYVISINYLPDGIKVDGLFITNSKRYNQQMTAISEKNGAITMIATSNLTRVHGRFDFTLDYESLIDRDAVVMDNSFIMILKVLSKVAVKHVYLAGFDGYKTDADNYYSSKMEYEFAKRLGEDINCYVNNTLPALRKKMDITFITPTFYEG